MSVVCFEDDELLRWWRPAITVIDNNAAEMGELAARLLLERINAVTDDPPEVTEYRIGTRLVIRDSCGPAASARAGATPAVTKTSHR